MRLSVWVGRFIGRRMGAEGSRRVADLVSNRVPLFRQAASDSAIVMTTDTTEETALIPGLRPCTPEEEEELGRMHAEHQRNVAHFLTHRARLMREHPNEFVLVYCEEDGTSRLKLGDLPALLHDPDHGPSSMIEWLGFELRG